MEPLEERSSKRVGTKQPVKLNQKIYTQYSGGKAILDVKSHSAHSLDQLETKPTRKS